MKINIGPIREIRGGVLEFQGNQEINSFQEIKELGLKFLGPVKVDGKVTNTGEGFLVDTELSFEYHTSCNRCLDEFDQKQRTTIKEEFISGYTHSEDDSAFGFTGDLIDLTECIQEQVILSLPMKFLCRPECRGFCPNCGTNLNEKECSCLGEEMNPQFEKLKSLLLKEGGGPSGKPNK